MEVKSSYQTKDIMNKTMNIQKNKMNQSLIE